MNDLTALLVEPLVAIVAGACVGIASVDLSKRVKRAWVAVSARRSR